MVTLQFKTNIKCSACVEKAGKALDEETEIQEWKVDVTSNDKILTVKGENISPELVQKTLDKAGYKIVS
jgi:copper chaperone